MTSQLPRSGTHSVAISDVASNPQNPRDEDDPELRGLVETMQNHGQLQPIMVVDSKDFIKLYPSSASSVGSAPWVVLGGNRRLAAAQQAGLRRITVNVVPCASHDDVDQLIIIENGQRKELPPLREAEKLHALLGRNNRTVRSVAKLVGKSHAYVQQRLDLLKLIPEYKELLAGGAIGIKEARTIAIKPTAVQEDLFEQRSRRRVTTKNPRSRQAVRQGKATSTSSSFTTSGAVSATPPGQSQRVNPVTTPEESGLSVQVIVAELEKALAALRAPEGANGAKLAGQHVAAAQELLDRLERKK